MPDPNDLGDPEPEDWTDYEPYNDRDEPECDQEWVDYGSEGRP